MFNATPLLKAYAHYRSWQINRYQPAQIQEQMLLKLVRKARSTRFGTAHGFNSVRSVADYQARVPLRKYEDMWQEYWQEPFPRLANCSWPGTIPYYAVSSGTTSGTTKYLPYTRELQKSNTQAGLDLLTHHVRNKPDSEIFAGRSFVLGGSTELKEEASGIFSGDLSGISAKTLPFWAQSRFYPPADLALLKNWEEKIEIFSQRCLSENIRMISGVPSWMLIFFDRLFELHPEAEGRLVNLFPDLEMIVHGGVNFEPYYGRFKELLTGSSAELREVYPASEGFIAIADRGYRDGMRLNLDIGLFYEFVPLDELESANPTRHWIGTVQPDIQYAIVLTTCGGLWSYILGDTIRFVDTAVPRLLVTGRTSYYLSAFGEHLIADEIEDSISSAASTIDNRVLDYSVGPRFPQKERELGRHIYVVEFERYPSSQEIELFIERLDTRLSERNEDYEAHRAEGYGLDLPEIIPVASGFFARWMKKRGKLGGQHKVPRIINKQELFTDLLESAKDDSPQTS